jgi:ABC-type multidrug transport system fused ATPase/permease subunit
MDHIIVLSEGRIVEQGTFDELVRANGVFASMAAKQGIFAAA